MNSRIIITSSEVRPERLLQGRVECSLKKPNEDFFIHLLWKTEGRGTEDLHVVEKQALTFDSQNSANFELNLPGEPYSFSGQLVSVSWFLELTDSSGNDLALLPFILSPDGQERILGKVANPQSKQSKIRFGK